MRNLAIIAAAAVLLQACEKPATTDANSASVKDVTKEDRTRAAASAKICGQSPLSGVAEVVGEGRAYFHGGAEICPGDEAYCLQRSYVIPKDRVVTSISQDGYTCVFMPGHDTMTSGWIESKRLRQAATESSPPTSAWEGVWESDGVMSVKVGLGEDGLRASGVDDWDDGDGRNHHAEFSGLLRVSGNHARLDDDGCGVDFVLLDEFMIVEDETSCGPNTSFRGVYRRKP
ncbi:hypothetical protein [Caulobacter sp. 17J65-9]|uniref:hypothetical protein n=1 Tax=Caulobacter sp. 17J65-9 TaxID=2709382 RepID=UPI0013CC1A29|nr:hypothetical protein [Caulobacter sp. 17J65-9]NEX92901.1 hypothetical protein [Caulobacter sp. 17J65-9]